MMPGRNSWLWLLIGAGLSVGPIRAQPYCSPGSPPSGTFIEVVPAQSDSLRQIVADAAAGSVIALHPGTYDMDLGDASSRLVFDTPGVTLTSYDGDRDSVVLDGHYQTNELISIHASDVSIIAVTLQRAYDHPIHVSGTAGHPITGVVLRDLRIVDPGQQAIKINAVGDGYADDGLVECSHIELTPVGRAQVRDNCYTGGVDAHAARGWVVRGNRIEGFWCAGGLSEHAVHFWRASRDTLVEQNVIVDCARGVGFGLGDQGGSRFYPDDPYPEIANKGHVDGIIRNNFIATADAGLQSSGSGFDVGVGLEQAHGARVFHNSIASSQPPRSSSIEWRFTATSAAVVNNLVTHNLKQRDGGQASLAGNLTDAPSHWFASVALGDLHLASDTAAAIDAGAGIAPGLADRDVDDEIRFGPRDVGADERGPIFSDGFESGDTTGWPNVVP